MIYELRTARFKYPVKVKEEFKWNGLRMKITMQGNIGDAFTTQWFWNVGILKNIKDDVIRRGIEKVEATIETKAISSLPVIFN